MLNHKPTAKLTWSSDVHVTTSATKEGGKDGKGMLSIVVDEQVPAGKLSSLGNNLSFSTYFFGTSFSQILKSSTPTELNLMKNSYWVTVSSFLRLLQILPIVSHSNSPSLQTVQRHSST